MEPVYPDSAVLHASDRIIGILACSHIPRRRRRRQIRFPGGWKLRTGDSTHLHAKAK